MPGPTKLDGAGVQKLKTIDEAHVQLQRLHGIVEHYGLAVKQNKPASQYIQQVKRSLPVLVGLLKPQFGLIADQVASLQPRPRVAAAMTTTRLRGRSARCCLHPPAARHRHRPHQGQPRAGRRAQARGRTPRLTRRNFVWGKVLHVCPGQGFRVAFTPGARYFSGHCGTPK